MKTPEKVAFLTDTTICIGCKACEVACKEWNGIESEPISFKGDAFGYDNTGRLDASNWRHVSFIEQPGKAENTPGKWLMMSDVCKHCTDAPCLNVCPTHAITRTEFDTVYIQQDVCNGCQNCVSACPYGVIGTNHTTGKVNKCTFCYDRLQNDLTPACAKACPTSSIQFGSYPELLEAGKKRVQMLKAQGVAKAQLYGENQLGGLRSLYVLVDQPEVYKLPAEPRPVQNNNLPGYLGSIITVGAGLLGAVVALRRRGGGGGGSDGTPTTVDTTLPQDTGKSSLKEPLEVQKLQKSPEVPNA